jgi:hypothetical protein
MVRAIGVNPRGFLAHVKPARENVPGRMCQGKCARKNALGRDGAHRDPAMAPTKLRLFIFRAVAHTSGIGAPAGSRLSRPQGVLRKSSASGFKQSRMARVRVRARERRFAMSVRQKPLDARVWRRDIRRIWPVGVPPHGQRCAFHAPALGAHRISSVVRAAMTERH